MSLQKFDKAKQTNDEYTYASLIIIVNSLNEQVSRTKEVASELETIDDIKKNNRLQYSYSDCQKRYEKYNAIFKTLQEKETEEENLILKEDINNKLDLICRTIKQLRKQINSINQRHTIYEEKEHEAQIERERIALIEEQKSAAQMEEEQRKNDLEFTQRNIDDIGNTMTIVNELTKEVDDKITDQHDTVVAIDDTINEAKSNMEQGNEIIDEAAMKEKKSKRIWVLLGIFIILFAFIALIILHFVFHVF